MQEQDLLNFLNALEGQCQAERFPSALDPDSAPLDSRDLTQMVESLRSANQTNPAILAMLPKAERAQVRDGLHPPHHGLLLTILTLLQHSQRLLNTFTARHLELQFSRILGFRPRPPQANRVWVSLMLRKNAAPVMISPGHAFIAGEAPNGQPQLFAPLRPVYVGRAILTELYRQRVSGGRVMADVAAPTDIWSADKPQHWDAFGNDVLPLSRVGFAVASPLLRLAEGRRTITVKITASGDKDVPLHLQTLHRSAFSATCTCEAGWFAVSSLKLGIEPSPNTEPPSELKITFTVTLEPDLPAVIDFDRKIHSQAFAAIWPVLQFRLEPAGMAWAQSLSRLRVRQLGIQVEAADVRNLSIRNNTGVQDCSRSFPLFGPLPVQNDVAAVNYDEAAQKPLEQLKLQFGVKKDGNTESSTIGIKSSWSQSSQLFINNERLINNERRSEYEKASANQNGGSGEKLRNASTLSQPSLSWDSASLLVLELQSEPAAVGYQLKLAQYLSKQEGVRLPDSPKIPELISAALTYRTPLVTTDLSDSFDAEFLTSPIAFYHSDSFGVRRDHAAMRKLSSAGPGEGPGLLSELRFKDSCFLGLQHAQPGESLSLLIDIVHSSEAAGFTGRVQWSVLCGDFWKVLAQDDIPVDTTKGLRQSGLVQLTLPADATTQHSLMPENRLWLRIDAPNGSEFRSTLGGIYCHGVELEFHSGSLEMAAAAIPPGQIQSLQQPLPGIKSVQQPLPGFGGRPLESQRDMYTRAAERLRHRNRAITAWDYERLTLQAFPEIERVKCIPHSDGTCWTRPGHVTVVLVPDVHLRGKSAALRPQVPQSLLQDVESYLQSCCPMGVTVHAVNPCYQGVQAEFGVRFLPGRPFGFYRTQLEQSLVQHLTPWIQSRTADVRFGGTIYRAAVLDFVEDLEYVDFVTDFRCFHGDLPQATRDDWMLQATRPDGILVSAPTHLITEYQEAKS